MPGVHKILSILALAVSFGCTSSKPLQSKPQGFLQQVDDTTWIIGNNVWNLTQGRQYAKPLWYKGKDRVGDAVGHYVSYNGAASDMSWTSAAIVESGSDYVNVRFTAQEGDFHWVIYDDLAGAYQYFVNHALPVLGEFRTLWRLDNASFPRGRTNIKDDVLPPLSEYVTATKVQDETWQKEDGTFLTKYDWAAFPREQDYYGVYGDEVGSWYINPGKDYYNGDHLKQELMIHRESMTGDAVQLNMVHGTHYMAVSSDAFDDGKTWGPWLWYLNDGSKGDVEQRWNQEQESWPYKWFKDAAYQSRGNVQGRIMLGDGRPAAGAAVFLGDNDMPNVTALDQGKRYYYTTYADNEGNFRIDHVRAGTYALQAWSNGGNIADVATSLFHGDVVVGTDSQPNIKLTWEVTDSKNRIFQVGDFDRRTTGFKLSGPAPFEHGRIAKIPANVTYTVGKSKQSDWYFGQSALGTQSITFNLSSIPSSASGAKLTVSLAGFSSGSSANILLNGQKVGIISSSTPLVSSQDTYRGATTAGEWHLLEFPVSKSLLQAGDNTLEFNVTKSSLWHGWLWDSILMDWV